MAPIAASGGSGYDLDDTCMVINADEASFAKRQRAVPRFNNLQRVVDVSTTAVY
jgi:hypothetical protein